MNAKRNKAMFAKAARAARQDNQAGYVPAVTDYATRAGEQRGPWRTVRERYAFGMRQAARQAQAAEAAYAAKPAYGSARPNFRPQRVSIGRGFHS